MQRRSTQGVVFVHACPKALCQHVEWALERVVGAPVSLTWAEQPAAHGSYRAEVAWTGSPGTGARLVHALRAWPMLRFEVTEESTTGTAPSKISPVEPSMEMTSPSRTVLPPRTVNSPVRVSTSRASAPHTQVRPMPRATTAA